jgi:hypothetical protein
MEHAVELEVREAELGGDRLGDGGLPEPLLPTTEIRCIRSVSARARMAPGGIEAACKSASFQR